MWNGNRSLAEYVLFQTINENYLESNVYTNIMDGTSIGSSKCSIIWMYLRVNLRKIKFNRI